MWWWSAAIWTTKYTDDGYYFIDGVKRDENLNVVFVVVGQPPRRTDGNKAASGVADDAAGNDDVAYDGCIVGDHYRGHAWSTSASE